MYKNRSIYSLMQNKTLLWINSPADQTAAQHFASLCYCTSKTSQTGLGMSLVTDIHNSSCCSHSFLWLVFTLTCGTLRLQANKLSVQLPTQLSDNKKFFSLFLHALYTPSKCGTVPNYMASHMMHGEEGHITPHNFMYIGPCIIVIVEE